MKKTYPGNEAAYRNLANYAGMEHPAPLILLGKRGLGKKAAAISAASRMLGVEEEKLSASAGFYALDKGQEMIRVDDVLEILEKSTFTPLGNLNVFLICHADRMNAMAQNKMLKLLEDRNSTNAVIFLCDHDLLIDTVKSRCMTICFHPLSDAGMEEYLAGKGIEEDRSFISHLCGNCPGLLEEILAFYPALKDICSAIVGIGRREDLLRIFHLVQEKDPSEFYSAHADHYGTALQALQHLFAGLLLQMVRSSEPAALTTGFGTLPGIYTMPQLHMVCTAIAAHQKRWLAGHYTKNDFFDLVRTMILCED